MAWLNQHAVYAEVEECLEWPFKLFPSGYGAIFDDRTGEKRNASRVMCEVAHGPPPTMLHQAAHTCGKGHLGCVNPNHLSWKTPAQNQADRLEHGTDDRGDKSHRAVLSSRDVQHIRTLLSGGMRQADIADRYGVTREAITAINIGKNWGHLATERHE
jgi:hypothetical protein